ncbi:MAG: DUF2796 domain-containing protein [Bacteriovorax sp.]|jgi:hypothetical protein
MKSALVTLGFLFTACAMAGEHSLHSHEHGALKLGMAVEKNTVDIDMDGPAESFLGFEYAPKTAKEKKLLADLEAKWTKNLEAFIAFDKKLNCKVSEASFKQIIEEKEAAASKKDSKESGVHSEIEATAKVVCAANLAGSEVSISLRKIFTHIKKLSVEVLSGETKSVEITKPVQVFKL